MMQDKKKINNIFLSASIPSPKREKNFYDTADILAIRDAVKALATVVIPKAHLIWGGHPAITPLIRVVMNKMGVDIKSHVTLYQSEFFRSKFPADNSSFENIIIVPANINRDLSLLDMRNAMINNHEYKAGIFIGGMEGVIDEYQMFKNSNPESDLIPIASTGAAASIIYNQLKSRNIRLKKDYAYMSLFRDLLKNYL